MVLEAWGDIQATDGSFPSFRFKDSGIDKDEYCEIGAQAVCLENAVSRCKYVLDDKLQTVLTTRIGNSAGKH